MLCKEPGLWHALVTERGSLENNSWRTAVRGINSLGCCPYPFFKLQEAWQNLYGNQRPTVAKKKQKQSNNKNHASLSTASPLPCSLGRLWTPGRRGCSSPRSGLRQRLGSTASSCSASSGAVRGEAERRRSALTAPAGPEALPAGAVPVAPAQVSSTYPVHLCLRARRVPGDRNNLCSLFNPEGKAK